MNRRAGALFSSQSPSGAAAPASEPSSDSDFSGEEGDTVLFSTDNRSGARPLLDEVPAQRPMTTSFLAPLARNPPSSDEDNESDDGEEEDDEGTLLSSTSAAATQQPPLSNRASVHDWPADAYAESPESAQNYRSSPMTTQNIPSWATAKAPPRSDSRGKDRPTPPPKPSVAAATGGNSPSSTRDSPSSPSPSSPNPGLEPYYGSSRDQAPPPAAPQPGSSRGFLSSLSSVAMQGLKIAMVKGSEFGHAAKEWGQYAAERTQESWDRQKEKRAGEYYYDDDSKSTHSGTSSTFGNVGRSNSWFSRGSSTTVFTAALGSTTKFCLPAPAPPQLPALFIRCLQVLDREDVMREYVGLYRISASRRELDRLRGAIEADQGGDIDFGWWEEAEPRMSREGSETASQDDSSSMAAGDKREDPNAVAGLLKMFLREGEFETASSCRRPSLHEVSFPAPGAAIPPSVASQFDALDLSSKSVASGLRLLLLPAVSPSQLALLASLFCHLQRVSAHSDENKMTSGNLAIVFAPTLGSGASVSAIEALIDNADEVFPEEATFGYEELKRVPRPVPRVGKSPKRAKSPEKKPELPPRRTKTDPPVPSTPDVESSLASLDLAAATATAASSGMPASPTNAGPPPPPPAKPPKPSKSSSSNNPFSASVDRMVVAVKSSIKRPVVPENPFATVKLRPADVNSNPFATLKPSTNLNSSLDGSSLLSSISGPSNGQILDPNNLANPFATIKEKPRLPAKKPELSSSFSAAAAAAVAAVDGASGQRTLPEVEEILLPSKDADNEVFADWAEIMRSQDSVTWDK